MCSNRAKKQAPARQDHGVVKHGVVRDGSVRRLTLLLALCGLAGGSLAGCGEGESVSWVGVQDCAVGIPPESGSGAAFASVQLPLTEALVTPLGSGFSIRNFTLGPIGAQPASFSCEALQVTARFVPASQSAGQSTGQGRALELLPFECRGSDGRISLLDGEGQGSDDAFFFNQTFVAWLGAERATLVCSTRFQRQLAGASPDAGLPLTPLPFGPAPVEPLAP